MAARTRRRIHLSTLARHARRAIEGNGVLKTPWHDDTRHLVFDPLEFLEKLAALIASPARVGL